MVVLRAIINSGIGFTHTASAKRGVFLSNAISLTLLIISLVTFFFYYIWYGPTVVTFLILLLGFVLALGIVINRLGKTTLSRIWISLTPPLLVLSLSVYSKVMYYDQQQELDYFTFRIVMLGSCVIPLITFTLKERTPLVVTMIIGFSLLMFHDPIHDAFGVPYQQDKLKVLNYYFTNIVIALTYAMLIGSLVFLKWSSERNEDQNIAFIKDLNIINALLGERNAEIEAQSTEIMAQSETLNENQSKLLEANRLIEQQRNSLVLRNNSLESALVAKNEDLIKTNAELIKHNNELRQFSYAVSHNLRGPVARLLGLTNLVGLDHMPDHTRQMISYIETSTLQLDEIINDLNRIIDIRQDIFKVRQKIDLDAEISDIVRAMHRDLENNNVSVNYDLSACRFIYSIKPMVNSILYNLISNGIKYRSSDRLPTVEIKSAENDSFYILKVSDNGLGIDLSKNRENLFKLYKRFHFHTDGKGLGLYLVKLQSEALGGSVEVASELNRGTKFTISLKKPKNIDQQILYTGKNAEIFFDAILNATGIIWKGSVTSEEYRSVFRKCLDFVRTYNTPNYISDMSHQGTISQEDQQWMFTEILPPAIENGLRKIATIRADSDDPLVIAYAGGISKTIASLGVEHRFFRSMAFASEWIRETNEDATLKSQS
jgi:signal transduction histidine kinase